MQKIAGIELTELTQKLLKSYCDETGEDPKEVLIKGLRLLLDRQKQNKELAEQYETVKV